ncbi:hypothetical protein BDV06DRAFT_199276 [Aspergillus oleicola]
MGDHVLFFYGTLMAPQILHRVIYGLPTPAKWQKDLLRFRPAILHEYRRHRVRYADYPGILKDADTNTDSAKDEPGAGTGMGLGAPSVLGTVVSGLTDGDLHRLDIFEGDQYAREKVSVRILRETLSEDMDPKQDKGNGNGGEGSESDADRHLKDVLEAAGAEFADEGESVEAETYVWIAGREGLEDAEWDFEAFKRDKMAWWVNADESEW